MINRGFLKSIRGKYILAHPNLEICLPVACQGEEDKILHIFLQYEPSKRVHLHLPPSLPAYKIISAFLRFRREC